MLSTLLLFHVLSMMEHRELGQRSTKAIYCSQSLYFCALGERSTLHICNTGSHWTSGTLDFLSVGCFQCFMGQYLCSIFKSLLIWGWHTYSNYLWFLLPTTLFSKPQVLIHSTWIKPLSIALATICSNFLISYLTY